MPDEQIIIIGAGPCGLAAAVELQSVGLSPLVIEKRNVVHSISQYPTYMNFFSTPANLEIADIPFTTANEKPSRLEALNYYRSIALRKNVRMHAYETVTAVEPQPNGGFVLRSHDRYGEGRQYRADAVIVATGYFDHPNLIGIPGEELDKVTHFFREAHPYTGMKVAIIGGSNSAIDAALELERVGADVTVVYRGETYSSHIKPWVRPGFEGLVNKGRIGIRFASRVVEIGPRTVTVERDGVRESLPNDFVLALTGFRPDRAFLNGIGVTMEDEGYPTFDDETMESNVPGVYLAGVVASRHEANEIFIESGRFHGRKIAAHLLRTGKIRAGR
ncbi:YpdA family putative bacillithiol disulfide reductase [Paenibacillus sp. MWE-103]|uniref:YpdA family putative bacillithiol disulfide reductase n=1 Tax=Paenibacillus artemisiicola TaxID=1172618 RepID=A0ABS3WCF5_9BACL|nr:YpdA family putative bacillithiol disulfide reductase [Paenibacillus artemisiicola]MBO7745997.1 YpdA family putative bacillithiol disulfide reductase [Paenibacillus artemisiicola]